MQLDELARDRQPKTGAVMRTRRRRIDLGEFVEDQLVVAGGDPTPRITNFDADLFAISAAARECDLSSRQG